MVGFGTFTVMSLSEQSDTYISCSFSDVPRVGGSCSGCSARSRNPGASTGRGPTCRIAWVSGVDDVAVVETDGITVAGINNG